MSTVEQAPPGVVHNAALRPLLRQAHRTWRRAGVLRVERERLGQELQGELVAAAEAGRALATVLGEDPRRTLQEWAHEQDVSGRALRVSVLVPLTLVSVLVGSLVIITEQVVERFVPGAPFITHGAIWLAILINSTVVSWLLAPLSCWAALHRGGDPRAASTGRWLLVLLPLAAFTALLLDILIATISATEGPFILIMSVVTAATFASSPVAARYLATRYSRQR